MNVFLQFLFDLNKVEKFVKPGWIEILDPSFIQDNVFNNEYMKKVIGGLEGHIPLIKDLLSSISSKATGKKSDLIASMEQSLQNEADSNDGDPKPTQDGAMKKPPTK